MTYEERQERKEAINRSLKIKAAMTDEQRIMMLNTPYRLLPEELKPGMTKNPQLFNFVRFSHLNIGAQKDTFGARLIRYRKAHGFRTQEEFCDYCNEFAKKYDLPATENRRGQKTRITKKDMENYEYNNVSPKIDKMTVIAEAMELPIDYVAGYGPKNRRSRNVVLAAKYRKNIA